MPRRLTDRPDGRTTDHSEEIHALRERVRSIRLDYGLDDDGYPGRFQSRTYRIQVLECVAALLEAHDETLISLDEWSGPSRLVDAAMEEVGLPPYMPNGG